MPVKARMLSVWLLDALDFESEWGHNLIEPYKNAQRRSWLINKILFTSHIGVAESTQLARRQRIGCSACKSRRMSLKFSRCLSITREVSFLSKHLTVFDIFVITSSSSSAHVMCDLWGEFAIWLAHKKLFSQ